MPSNWINCIAIDESGNKWIGTGGGGLAKFDGTNWTVYNTSNSGLPSDGVKCIAIDDSGNKWIGFEVYSECGLAKFDGTNWTVYNTSNSGLPSNWINCIAIDDSGNKWIGTAADLVGGLARFDGTNWTVYNTSNSGLPSSYIKCIAIDDSNNKWIGTGDNTGMYGPWGTGLVQFDGTNWTVYNTSNSGLPGNYVSSIVIDSNNNKWIGSFWRDKWHPLSGGLSRFDGTNWTVYDPYNSGLPDYYLSFISIDESGNKWIGMFNSGMAVFNEGGVVSIEPEKKLLPVDYSLQQNYPNPFNPVTAIAFDLPKTSQVTLKIYNILGEEVATLVSGKLPAGSHVYDWNASGVASAVYLYRLEVSSQSSGQGFVQTRKMVLMR